MTIYLLPYGGGSASSYRSYASRFPSAIAQVVPVELPGRGRRSDEACARSIPECAGLALHQIHTTAKPYILHGHCMGALLAFEAARIIEASGQLRPLFIVVSGRNAPHHINEWLRRLPELSDRGLFKELQDLGGIPRGLSFSMAQPFLALLRKDQAMIHHYRPGRARIGVPILALSGRADRMTTAAGLTDWATYTSKWLSIEWLDGEHYSLLDQPDRAAEYIAGFAKTANTAALGDSR